MIIQNENELIDYGRKLASKLQLPAVIELVGDVGAGKTTFTRGLATGLGVKEPITSPSFTIAKRYHFPVDKDKIGTLVHYDFYRLPDPGIMYEELAETISDPLSVVVIEWGESVSDLLPEDHLILHIKINDNNTRTIS